MQFSNPSKSSEKKKLSAHPNPLKRPFLFAAIIPGKTHQSRTSESEKDGLFVFFEISCVGEKVIPRSSKSNLNGHGGSISCIFHPGANCFFTSYAEIQLFFSATIFTRSFEFREHILGRSTVIDFWDWVSSLELDFLFT